MVRVFCLKPEEIENCWEDFAVLLHRFELICRDITVDQIVEAVKHSTMQFFGLQDESRVHGFVVTEIHKTARGPICVLVGACGWAPDEDKRAILSHIEEWARSQHCVALKIIGRKGWRRWDRRFKATGEVLECPL